MELYQTLSRQFLLVLNPEEYKPDFVARSAYCEPLNFHVPIYIAVF